VAWVALPITAGPAVSETLDAWSTGPRIAGATMLWTAWGAGLVATLAPRPIGLTLLRSLAPAFIVVAAIVAISGEASTLATVGALVGSGVAAAVCAHPDVAIAAANGVSYGDEQRFPLHAPPALFLGPLPLARIVAVGGVAAGPLLLADGRVVASAITLALGFPLAYLAWRALHTLSRRWIVLVPAGVVIVDPMTLADPVLFPREHVRALRGFDATTPPPDVLDLRLGAFAGSTELVLAEEADLFRTIPARRTARRVRSARILVAVVRRQRMLETAAQRRVRVEVR
jgi:hypothetical protein